MGFIGRQIAECGEWQFPLRNSARDLFQRPDFRRRQTDLGQPWRTCAQDGGGLEWIERGREPAPDRARTRRRKLLRNYRSGEAGKAVGTSPQRRPPCRHDQRGKTRIGLNQRGDAVVEVEVGADVGEFGHRCY